MTLITQRAVSLSDNGAPRSPLDKPVEKVCYQNPDHPNNSISFASPRSQVPVLPPNYPTQALLKGHLFTSMVPFGYETPNSVLIRDLKLEPHPEGGYFAETVRAEETIQTPFVAPEDGEKRGKRVLGTTIYYLLTTERHDNFVHMNKSTTMHVLHQGRAEYVLIYPGSAGGKSSSSSKPVVKRVVMGPDTSRGEVRQLYVESGVWKMSRLLDGDLREVVEGRTSSEVVGCLITEVVVPGFEWEDHQWMRKGDLESLFPLSEGEEAQRMRKLFEGHVKSE